MPAQQLLCRVDVQWETITNVPLQMLPTAGTTGGCTQVSQKPPLGVNARLHSTEKQQKVRSRNENQLTKYPRVNDYLNCHVWSVLFVTCALCLSCFNTTDDNVRVKGTDFLLSFNAVKLDLFLGTVPYFRTGLFSIFFQMHWFIISA